MGCFPSRKGQEEVEKNFNLPRNTIFAKKRPESTEEKERSSIVNNNIKKLSSSKIYSGTIKIKNYITKNDSKVEDNYRILNKLGKGSFGSVFKVLQITTGILRAMKVIKKDSLAFQDDDQKFLKEIEILILTDHPNIIKIYEYYFDDVNFYLITEFVSGGELYDTILSWKSFDEEKAAYIMTQILSAVNYLHKKNIVHRDIKPENMLVENKFRLGNNKKEMINIKLIDFGTCNYVTDKNLTLKVGSPYYIAPEVLKRNYNEKCDIWSCGIILYILLVGYPPFSGSNTTDLLKNVAKGEYSLKSSEWKKVSKEAKDLVRKMLEINPQIRINAEECLNHPWIKSSESLKANNVDSKYFEYVIKNMCDFNAKEKLQQATIAYIVHFLYTSQEIDTLKNVFKQLDKDGDGILSYSELKNGIEKCFGNYKTEVEMNKIIQIIDNDNSGTISYEEFLRVSVDQSKLLEEKNLKIAFERFDTDKDGRLSKEEIKLVLGTSHNDYIFLLLNSIDQNNDGYISFEEFSTLMNGVISNGMKKKSENNHRNSVYINVGNSVHVHSSTGMPSETGYMVKPNEKAIISNRIDNCQIERDKALQHKELFDGEVSSSDSSVVGDESNR